VTERLAIVGLGGSLAGTSRSLAALRVALDGAAEAGAATTLLNLRELDLPMHNPDHEGEPPPAATTLMEACYGAKGMLWSSPMYQGTISGAFKNALDWLHALGSREPPFLHDQVIGLISAAGGTQGLQAINTMEFAVRRFAAGPSRTWFRSPPRTASSTRKAASPTKASSCSCGR
jgi:FMN reductase